MLHLVAHWLALGLNTVAILVIAYGAVLAVAGIVASILRKSAADGFESRQIWLDFAHWLVAGLTFQLAADIVETVVAPTWDDIGRLASIAVIRTFLTYFLDRDIESMRARQALREAQK